MSNEGFTVKCNRCGRSLQVADKKDKFSGIKDAVTNGKGITFELNCSDETACIRCKCGNILYF